MSSEPIVSHGRGGAGNIEPDEKVYTDGEIVREGTPFDGPHTSGRGGAGNLETPPFKPRKDSAVSTGSVDVIPETALRPAPEYEKYHTGRGGEGNVHREHPEEHEHEHEGLKEKAKHLFGVGGKDKEKEKEGEREGA